MTSKAWTTQDGKTRDGKPIDKGHIYKLLSNRTYLGELPQGQWYQANIHPSSAANCGIASTRSSPPMVGCAATRRGQPWRICSKGIVFGNDGGHRRRCTTKKNGRRYRYYVPQRDATRARGRLGLPRFAGRRTGIGGARPVARHPACPEFYSATCCRQAIKLDPTLDEAKITVAMTRLDAIWDQLFPAEQTRIVKLLVEKVIVSPNDLEVRVARQRHRTVGAGAAPRAGRATSGGTGMSDIRIQKPASPTSADQRWQADPVRADPDQTPQRSQAGHLAKRRNRAGQTVGRGTDIHPTGAGQGHRWLAMLESGRRSP